MRVFDNSGIGIVVGGGSMVTSNIVMRNGSDGIGIHVADDEDKISLITDNVASAALPTGKTAQGATPKCV